VKRSGYVFDEENPSLKVLRELEELTHLTPYLRKLRRYHRLCLKEDTGKPLSKLEELECIQLSYEVDGDWWWWKDDDPGTQLTPEQIYHFRRTRALLVARVVLALLVLVGVVWIAFLVR
jgi:hypothetical protein